jgi:hypothetical protein
VGTGVGEGVGEGVGVGVGLGEVTGAVGGVVDDEPDDDDPDEVDVSGAVPTADPEELPVPPAPQPPRHKASAKTLS